MESSIVLVIRGINGLEETRKAADYGSIIHIIN